MIQNYKKNKNGNMFLIEAHCYSNNQIHIISSNSNNQGSRYGEAFQGG